MKLDTISFTEFPNSPGEWRFDPFNLGEINLVVARNAVGKTRLLKVIGSFAKLLSGETKELTAPAKFHAQLSTAADKWTYDIEIGAVEITREDLFYNGQNVLHRDADGTGTIEATEARIQMRFSVPRRQAAVVAKRDLIQHPYLEALYNWGVDVRHFHFGSEMSPDTLSIKINDGQAQINEKETANLAAIFDAAFRLHGSVLTDVVLKDMRRMDYHISELKIMKSAQAVVHSIFPVDIVGVSAKEKDLEVVTEQPRMSQGMFRSLSLLIQTTHYMLSKKSGLIIVDDIGEGLDFERSCTLIDLLRAKAQQSSFQLLMSTNDRFVMNKVPLEEWAVLERDKGHVKIRTYGNSKEAFEDFKITGLNNFDLLATNFLAGRRQHEENGDLRGGSNGAGVHGEASPPHRR